MLNIPWRARRVQPCTTKPNRSRQMANIESSSAQGFFPLKGSFSLLLLLAHEGMLGFCKIKRTV